MRQTQLLVVAHLLACVAITSLSVVAQSVSDGADQASNVGNQAGAFGESLGASDTAKEISRKIPRVGGKDEFEPTPEYMIGILAMGFPGFLLAGITLLFSVLFFILRCCCNTCGGKQAKPEGYSKKKRFFPWLFQIAFLALALVFCSLGYHYNDSFSAGLRAEDSGVTKVLIGVVDDSDKFITDIRGPLDVLQNRFGPIVDNIVDTLGETESLATGTRGLTDRLDQQSAYMNGLMISTDNGSYVCVYCNGVATQISVMSNEIRQLADPLFTNLKSTVDPITDVLITNKASINITLREGKEHLDTVANTVEDYRKSAVDAMDLVEQGDEMRQLAVTILFTLPFISLILVVVGAVCKLAFIFGFNCVFLVIVSVFMFLLCGIHLPLSVLLGDVCIYADKVEAEPTTVLDAQSSKVLTSCLTNSSLIDTFNLTESLNFRDSIVFPDLPSISASFDFVLFKNFTNEVNGLTLSTFNYDPATLDSLLESYSTDPILIQVPKNPFYNRYDIEADNPSQNFGSGGVQARTDFHSSILGVLRTERSLNQTLNDMKRNVSSINDYANQLESNVTRLEGELNSIEGSLSPLFNTIDELKGMAYCGFLGLRYFQVKTAMCDTIASSMIMLSLCFFMVGATGLAGIILSIVLWKRIQHPRKKMANLNPSMNQMQGTPQVLVMQPMQMQPAYGQHMQY